MPGILVLACPSPARTSFPDDSSASSAFSPMFDGCGDRRLLQHLPGR
ncbi:MAG: hypothetical protein M0C28_13940 [Candidatus Moduliflexus flocculans]|nr:hypothetical protein [Candidatus Moduliflexus flocculans]